MKTEDPVNEVREIREAHAAEHGYDLDRIVEDIRKGEKRLESQGWKIVPHKKTQDKIANIKP